MNYKYRSGVVPTEGKRLSLHYTYVLLSSLGGGGHSHTLVWEWTEENIFYTSHK
jgi:hypothetical protein